MTTNLRVRMRREYDSDERFTALEHARILTHTNPLLCGTWYSAVFILEHSSCPRIYDREWQWLYLVPEIQFAYSWTRTCFMYYLNVYAFGTFICFGLVGLPFLIGSVLYLRGLLESPFCLASIADVLRASPRAPWGRNAWRSPNNVFVDYFFVSCSSMKEAIVRISQQNFIQ